MGFSACSSCTVASMFASVEVRLWLQSSAMPESSSRRVAFRSSAVRSSACRPSRRVLRESALISRKLPSSMGSSSLKALPPVAAATAPISGIRTSLEPICTVMRSAVCSSSRRPGRV